MAKKSLASVLQPQVVIGIVAVLAVAAVAIAWIMEGRTPSSQWVSPVSGPITQEVDTTGTVQAAESIDLSFQSGGRIASVPVVVGQTVVQGELLASLDASTLQAQLESAKAALAMQQANLQTLQNGATPQAVAVSQTAVSNAETAVLQAAQDAYDKSDDAIHNRVDQFMNNGRTPNPTLAFSLTNSQTQSSIVSGRVAMETLLSQWQAMLGALPPDPSQVNISELSSTTQGNLQQVSAYLDTVAQGLTEVVPTSAYPAAAIQGYQASIATARANVSADSSAINAASAAYASARSQLALTQSGPTATALDAQEAQVQAAQATVDAAQANISNTVIVAPISGTITVNNAKVGQTAAAGSPVISMQSSSQFQIQTYVSQTDEAKIKVGDDAQVSLDAYPDASPLAARVIAIDPAATVQNGVASYKVTLQFEKNDPSEKVGLTAHVNIATGSVESALSVPSSAVITQGTQTYVLKKEGSQGVLTPVSVGISSASGYTQIVSGISASDEIAAFGSQQ